MTRQSEGIIIEVEKLLNAGLTDKDEIISKVVENLNAPRPTVRRVIRDMRSEMERKIKILQSEIPLPSDPSQSRNEGL